MKILIALICSVVLNRYAIAQLNIVNVDFEVDGKLSTYKDAGVRFIYNNNTIITKIENGKLTIPESVYKKRAIVTFYIGKYVLVFDSIPVTLNSLNPKWTVGVDNKPFNKKRFPTIESWKNVQIVYYLNNADGRVFTVDSYKKIKVIMRG